MKRRDFLATTAAATATFAAAHDGQGKDPPQLRGRALQNRDVVSRV